MATWPVTLQDVPNQAGFSQVLKPNVVRSSMGYGPDKIRRRSTADWYNVTMQLWLDYTQLATLDQFYKDNMALTWDWLDFTKNPTVAARYRFMGPPSVNPLGALHWVVTLSLEMESP